MICPQAVGVDAARAAARLRRAGRVPGDGCADGAVVPDWIDTNIDGHPRIHVDFYNVSRPTCPAKPDCTTARFRGLNLRCHEQHEALQRREPNRTPNPGANATPPATASRAPVPRQNRCTTLELGRRSVRRSGTVGPCVCTDDLPGRHADLRAARCAVPILRREGRRDTGPTA